MQISHLSLAPETFVRRYNERMKLLSRLPVINPTDKIKK